MFNSDSHSRFLARINGFRRRRVSVVTHHLWWFVHNAIAHPLIAMAPFRPLFRFHDYTSAKINGR